MDTLVTAEWLRENLEDPNLVVLDCTVLIEQAEDGGIRTVSGRGNYEAGHIPTAGFADLTADLADGDSPYEFAVPTPERFAAKMGALGVGNDSRVVLYDAYTSAWAARVWWMRADVWGESSQQNDNGSPLIFSVHWQIILKLFMPAVPWWSPPIRRARARG